VDGGDLFRGAEEEEVQVEGEGNRLQDYIMDEEVCRAFLYYQGVIKRCRLSWLTNSASRIRVQMRGNGRGGGGVTGPQPMSIHMCTSRDMEPK
jgi:hypothetical protein